MYKTYNEIKSQHVALVTTKKSIDENFSSIQKEMCGSNGPIAFIGCGSSYLVACSAATIAQLHLCRDAIAIAGGDLLLHIETYEKKLEGATIVSLSRSGETSEILMSIKKLRERKVNFRLISFTCVKKSQLSNISDYAFDMPWAFDYSICQTRTVSCLYYALAYIMALLAKKQDLIEDLNKVIILIEGFMDQNEDFFKKIAMTDWTHAIVIGDAELSGICCEGALAFKEICQIPSNYYHFLDIRHGPIVLVNNQTLVIAVISQADGSLEHKLLDDFATKGATVVAYSDTAIQSQKIKYICFGEHISHIARGLPVIAMCQLIAYYKSFETKTNPDNPDGLDAWIKL